MRILFLVQFFGNEEVGGSNRPWDLTRCLVARGHDVTVICSSGHYLTERSEDGPRTQVEDWSGVRVIRLWSPPNFRRSFFHRLANYLHFAVSAFLAAIREPRPDLVLTSIQPIFVGPVGLIVSWLRRARNVLEVRDVWPDTALALGVLKPGFLSAASMWLARMLYWRAERIIALTPGIKRNIVEKGVEPERIYVIPNGYDVELFERYSPSGSPKAAFGWQDKFVVVYTGSHTVTDNLDTLIDAATLLRGRPDIQFVLVGEGDRKAGLRKRVFELGLTNVVFLDLRPRKDIPGLLAASDACALMLPSGEHWRLFLQNKFFDYLGSGKPVVAGVIGDQRDILQEAGAGICVTPGNAQEFAHAVAYLADHREEGDSMGRRGQAYVRSKFARPVLLQRYAMVLEEVFASSPSR